MIDPSVIESDARANLLDWPAKIRHKGRVITVGLSAIEDMLALMPGGQLDDMSFSFMAIGSDFAPIFPKTNDECEVQLKDGTWLKLMVRNTPDRYDPISPTITVYLQSPNK